jgi:hypothetical protein
MEHHPSLLRAEVEENRRKGAEERAMSRGEGSGGPYIFLPIDLKHTRRKKNVF